MAFKMKGFPKHKVKSPAKHKTWNAAAQEKMSGMSAEESRKWQDANQDKKVFHSKKMRLNDGKAHSHTPEIKWGDNAKKEGSPTKSRKRKLKKGKLLKSENPDVAVTGGSIQEQINDLEDRIEFIMEDIERGTATRQQNKDIKAMEKRIATLRKQRDKDLSLIHI